MIILVDSRQKKGKHDQKHNYLKSQGHTLLICKLPYGDYINATDIDDGLLLEIELLDFIYNKGNRSRQTQKIRKRRTVKAKTFKH